MTSNLYNILSAIDSICETYEQKYESKESKESKENETKDNIRYIRNVLNFRNLNDNYNNNRNIISNVFQRGTTSNIISLFITNYMNNRDGINNINENKEDNNDFKEIKFLELDNDIKKDDCSICFESFNQNDFVSITKCNHIYHKDCIIEWIKVNKTCPLCRRDI